MLTALEVLFVMALGRHGKAEIMMAGKCDRPYYITTNLETEREIDRNQEPL